MTVLSPAIFHFQAGSLQKCILRQAPLSVSKSKRKPSGVQKSGRLAFA